MGPLSRWGERLLPSEMEVEQLARMVRATPGPWLLSAVGALIAYGQVNAPMRGHVNLWLMVYLLLVAGRMLAWLWWRLRPVSRVHQPVWIIGILGSNLALAAMWGIFSGLLVNPQGAEAEGVLHICMVAVTLGGCARLEGYDRAMMAYVALVIGPLVLRDLWLGSSYHLLIALMVFLVGVFGVLIGANQSRALREIHAQRSRNAELLEALRQENHASQAARRAAEEAVAARTRFFAAANHDLRQPLHAMGLLANALREADDPAHLRDVSKHLVDCVDGMAAVVDDLLEITRMDGGSFNPQWTVFTLADLVEESCRPLAPLARAKGLALHVDVAPVVIRSDRAMLMRVVSNLVSNAVRYTAQGAVAVSATASAGHVRLDVQDTGIGIDAAYLPHIFEEFYQVGNPQRDRRKGLGLGLATVRRLCDLMQVPVDVRSRPGCGSVFSLTVPMATEPQLTADESPPPAAALSPPTSPLNGRQILVVDDDADARRALLVALRAWGCDACAAADLADSLALISRGFRPKAFVVDLRLGEGANGVDVVHSLRHALGDAALPALIVTGDAGSDRMLAAQAAGLTVMVKPAKPAQMRAFLGQVFGRD